jgi:hypothetical protein
MTHTFPGRATPRVHHLARGGSGGRPGQWTRKTGGSTPVRRLHSNRRLQAVRLAPRRAHPGDPGARHFFFTAARADSGTRYFGGHRPGSWINTIPAGVWCWPPRRVPGAWGTSQPGARRPTGVGSCGWVVESATAPHATGLPARRTPLRDAEGRDMPRDMPVVARMAVNGGVASTVIRGRPERRAGQAVSRRVVSQTDPPCPAMWEAARF